MKKYVSTICVIVIMTSMLIGCNSSKIINFKNNKYTSIENPSVEVGNIKKIGTKIGNYQGSDIYKLNGKLEKNWIYLDSQSMSDSPIGLYKSINLKMNSLTDFNSTELKILKASSNKEEIVYFTKQFQIIKELISSINNGKRVSENIIKIDNINKELTIQFRSKKFPNLVYTYDYIETKNNKYFISCEKNTIQIDNIINKYINNY